VVALTWSAGLLPVLQAAAQGRRPDAVVDAEAPADRWSLLPPEEAFRQGRAPEQARALQQWDPWQDSLWSELEAVRLLASLQAPYARLQAVDDHVHGTMHEHAARMVSAARETGQPVWFDPELPGRLHGHPLKVLEALDWAVRAVRRSQGTSGLDAC
jgi:hypothetical protein